MIDVRSQALDHEEVTRAVSNSEAARLADQLRAAMKAQSLSGVALAERVEQLTGKPFPPVYVSRRLNCSRPLITIADDLYVLCEALGLDPAQQVAMAIDQAGEAPEPAGD